MGSGLVRKGSSHEERAVSREGFGSSSQEEENVLLLF